MSEHLLKELLNVLVCVCVCNYGQNLEEKKKRRNPTTTKIIAFDNFVIVFVSGFICLSI